MAGVSTLGIITLSAQVALLLSLICCASSAKLPAESQNQAETKGNTNVISEGHSVTSGATGASSLAGPVARSLPIVASTDDFEVVAHTGGEGLGRQKRYIGWGRSPRLRYNKATSSFDHDSLFNRIHNNFDKRLGPEAPISSFRELRMKQKVPNIQVLLPHLQLRNSRVAGPDADGDDGAGLMINELDRPAGGKLTQEDLEALAYLLEGDMQ